MHFLPMSHGFYSKCVDVIWDEVTDFNESHLKRSSGRAASMYQSMLRRSQRGNNMMFDVYDWGCLRQWRIALHHHKVMAASIDISSFQRQTKVEQTRHSKLIPLWR